MNQIEEFRKLIKIKVNIYGLTEEDIAFLLEKSKEVLNRRKTVIEPNF